MMSRLRAWVTESRITVIVVVVMLISVLGTVGGSIYNAASVNNLTEAVTAVRQLSDQMSRAQEVTACRTSVQAAYDASIAPILLVAFDDAREEALTPEQIRNLIDHFGEAVDELALLEQEKICVGDNPTRVPIDK